MRRPEEYAAMAESEGDRGDALCYAILAVAAAIREASSSWRDLSLPAEEVRDRG